ncbi:leucyl aminopeptidase [Nonomuraea lactucae]|uniref:leucyl aminopeptidase n=1 Tax=Nonomuraea lactucae TaxID=2249762 RepID=UPI000DE3781F|nr:leucyl aminopeptidase [Nonomuraea lactucae]
MPIETTASVVADVPAGAELLAVPYTPDLAPVLPLDLPVPVPGLLAHYEAKGDAGEIVEVPVAREQGVGRVLLYGVGDGSQRALRKAAALLTRRARGRAQLTVVVPEGDAAAFAEAALLAAYTFKMGEPGKKPVRELRLVGADERAVRRGERVAQAVALARDLANTPASVKTPAWLAERAAEQGVPVRVWDEEQLRADGFGGILAVGRGSARPPRLIQLSYTPEEPPAGPATRHIVLVGKGITFDSGGLSLKPTENMKVQKTDMAGGAVVIAVIGALAALGAPVRVTGLVAAAENMPSGTAQRPSDVIRHYGGRTVEVLNTDAEGRLVLADALAYADAELEPDAVVDIATLTGAISVGLGRTLGAVYSSDDDLARQLLDAGQASDDRLWRMPLIDDYAPALESSIADLANVEKGSTYGAGSITAALFLREFAGKRPWAHLDIAGVGRSTVDEGAITKGATGFGVRVLLEWLTRRP